MLVLKKTEKRCLICRPNKRPLGRFAEETLSPHGVSKAPKLCSKTQSQLFFGLALSAVFPDVLCERFPVSFQVYNTTDTT